MDSNKYFETFTAALAESFRALLETKHLYQSVPTPLTSTPTIEMTSPLGPSQVQVTLDYLRKVADGRWSITSPATRVGQRLSRESGDNSLEVRPPDVKLFCETCDRREAFNLVAAADFLTFDAAPKDSGQLFVLSYRCQSCKATPEVFLVRREGMKLTLAGRSPIEHVEIPADIPKSVKRFYGGAIVAHQSGQTLAGNFMLRTLIEQWAREKTGRKEFADVVLDAYVASLPPEFKGRFPVLRETYSDLSEDIHGAVGSETAFEKARGEIGKHFKAREVFEI